MRTPFDGSFFLVKITDISAAPAYRFSEVWADTTGTPVVKIGGRSGTAQNPGYAVNGATFALNDLAFCRQAAGAGGTIWELAPLLSGAKIASGSVDAPGVHSIIADNTWEDTSSALPTLTGLSAGTYLLSYKVHTRALVSALAALHPNVCIQLRLYDVTAGAVVPLSIMAANPVSVAGVDSLASVYVQVPYTVPSNNTTIRIDAQRLTTSGGGTTTWSLSSVGGLVGGVSGNGFLSYLKLA